VDKIQKEILLITELTSIFIITIFLLIVATGIIMLVLVHQKKQIQYLSDKEHLKLQFSQTLLQSQIEIQEQTLLHISRELHDNLGHSASLIKIYLNTLSLTDTGKALAKIEDTKDLTRKLISDIKSLSVSMGTDLLAQGGLNAAIEGEVERLNKSGQFTASYSQQGSMPFIENDKAIIIYRMVQEVLNNMVKHSHANHISINLSVTEKSFTLATLDNGIGFNVEEKVNATGAGLRNLNSRALLINAQLHIQSTPGNGTNISITLPL